MNDRIQTDIVDTDYTIDDDSEPELDDFCRECDALYNKLVDVTVTPPYRGRRFKKDSRTWLHKNRKDDRDEFDPYKYVDEDDYEFAYSVVDKNGRRFKKDSRVWLHKVSKKSTHCDENTSCDNFLDEDSLTAMSKITIGKQRKEQMEKIGKKCMGYFRSGVMEKMIVAGLQRTRKRRKMGVTAPLSVLTGNDMNQRQAMNNWAAHKQKKSEVIFTTINETAEDNLSDSYSSNRCSRTSSQESLNETKQTNLDDSWAETKQMKSDMSSCRDGNNSPLTSEGCYDLATDSHIKAARFVLSCTDSKYEVQDDDSASCDTNVDTDEDLPATPVESQLELSRECGEASDGGPQEDQVDQDSDSMANLNRNCSKMNVSSP